MVGLAAAIADQLAEDGWDVATSHWSRYDERMPWGPQPHDVATIGESLRAKGAATVAVEADLSDVSAPAALFDRVETELGPVTALVLAHCESTDSSILDTTVESFDRHFAVNTRGSWLLIAEFARRYRGTHGAGRIVAITSDHTVHNLPYGASKGALDRIVLAAARELQDLRITANVVNPGPIDTGWMSDDVREWAVARSPRGRAGTPSDTAALVSFLCSAKGDWVNGQLLHSDGGIHA